MTRVSFDCKCEIIMKILINTLFFSFFNCLHFIPPHFGKASSPVLWSLALHTHILTALLSKIIFYYKKNVLGPLFLKLMICYKSLMNLRVVKLAWTTLICSIKCRIIANKEDSTLHTSTMATCLNTEILFCLDFLFHNVSQIIKKNINHNK